MRHATLLVVATLAVLLAASSAADARKKLRPGGVFDVLTAPMRALMPPAPRAVRYRGARRSYAARREQREQTARSRSEERAPLTAGAVAVTAGPFNAYEDILGYALWPNDYADRFWARGYGDIMRSVISPAATVASAHDDGANEQRGRRRAGARTSDADRNVTSAVRAVGMCGPQAREQANAPIDRIEQVIDLTGAQRSKLQDLRSAVGEAVERGKAACRNAPPRTPSDRLKAMMDGLWAMRDADILFRTPLDNFYRSLTDEQKARLSRGPQDATTGGPQPARATCGRAANDMPIEQIAQSVRPTGEQRASLDVLQAMSADLSDYLATACPQETPPSPVARLDAAGNRVATMLYAAMNLDQALNGFYFQLSDEQKKKFDSFGR